MSHWTAALTRKSACHEAIEWAREYESFADAWAACQRGDWMLWIAGRTCGEQGSEQHRAVVLAACACARLALKHVKKGEERPRVAIETAERWARGNEAVTLAMVRTAAYAAYAAAADAAAAAAAAADAADASAAAAYGADASASAASAAASAAYAAYAAADAADAARARTLKRCAGIVRKMVPLPKL